MPAGRPKGQLRAPTAGKKPGTKNVKPMETAAMRESIRQDCLAVYQKLGGQDWLLKFAQENPKEFVSQVFPRIAPPLPKPEEVVGGPPPLNLNVNLFELGRRIAFIMAKAEAEAPVKTIEHQPSEIDLANALAFKEACQQHQQPEPTPVPVGHTYSGSSVEQGRINPAPAVKKRRDLI